MAATIRDIARLAGVSVTTVSKILNNKNEVASEETRRRVLQVIEETGYKPNAIARGLVTKKTNTIGLIIPDITNQFFPAVARGVEDRAVEDGYNVFLCNTDDNIEKERKYLDALIEKCVDGIIITFSSYLNSSNLKELIGGRIPVVVMDRKINYSEINGVFLNNFKGAYMAVQHLVENGHRHIACITGPLSSGTSQERLEGYKRALLDNGIGIDHRLLVEGNYRFSSGESAAETLVHMKEVTAVFSCNDQMAIGFCKVAKRKGISIPEDISVVGFDDIEICSISEPQLTTIRQPAYEMGAAAADILITCIRSGQPEKRIEVFEPEIILRESVKKIEKG